MKQLVTADLHLRDWGDTSFTSDGLPKKLSDILFIFNSMCDYCVKNNINTMSILGDLNDTRGVVHVIAFAKFIDIILQYPKINFRILHGNHDNSTHKNTSAINLFSGIPNVEIITEPRIINKIAYIPWSNKLISDIEEHSSVPYLFSHFPLYGSVAGPTNQIIKGIVRPANLTKFKLVILGDIHKPQEIKHEKTIIYYVGSPIQLNRGEAGEQKRFIIFDDETGKIESVNTSGYREYHSIIIDENSNIDEIRKQLVSLKESGHSITIRKNTKENIEDDLDSILNDKTIKIIDENEEDFLDRGITSSMKIEDQMRKYLEIKNISNIDEYMQIGLNALNKKEV